MLKLFEYWVIFHAFVVVEIRFFVVVVFFLKKTFRMSNVLDPDHD